MNMSIRTADLARIKIGMVNLAYTMKRVSFLERGCPVSWKGHVKRLQCDKNNQK